MVLTQPTKMPGIRSLQNNSLTQAKHGVPLGRLHLRKVGFSKAAVFTFQPLLISTLWISLPEVPPDVGDCATCIGAVDGTLGSCAALLPCISSYDDRPGHFIAPWEFTGSREEAMAQLLAVLTDEGGTIVDAKLDYIHATFKSAAGQDDLEFLLADGDNTVALRAAARVRMLPDGGRNERRLEHIRTVLGWDQVPILRNRRQLLPFLETPWDTFGPVPPPQPDYSNVDDDLQ